MASWQSRGRSQRDSYYSLDGRLDTWTVVGSVSNRSARPHCGDSDNLMYLPDGSVNMMALEQANNPFPGVDDRVHRWRPQASIHDERETSAF